MLEFCNYDSSMTLDRLTVDLGEGDGRKAICALVG